LFLFSTFNTIIITGIILFWNNLTSTDSNNIENIQRKFVSLCFYRFSVSYVSKYDLISYSLNFRTLYSRRHLDALFLINVLKGKINCNFIMGTVGIRVSTRQIREFYFSLSIALRYIPSVRCVITAK
jgi:hypothetical protein